MTFIELKLNDFCLKSNKELLKIKNEFFKKLENIESLEKQLQQKYKLLQSILGFKIDDDMENFSFINIDEEIEHAKEIENKENDNNSENEDNVLFLPSNESIKLNILLHFKEVFRKKKRELSCVQLR